MTGVHEGHHVSDAEAAAVLDYATSVLKTLGMAQWVVLIMQEPCDEEAQATVQWVEGRYLAQIRLGENWMELRDEVRRNTITHEILHLVHSRVSDTIDDAHEFMRGHEYRPWRRRAQREIELMVDHFATALADTHRLTEAWEDAHNPPAPVSLGFDGTSDGPIVAVTHGEDGTFKVDHL